MITELIEDLRNEATSIGTGKPAVLMARAANMIEHLVATIAELRRREVETKREGA